MPSAKRSIDAGSTEEPPTKSRRLIKEKDTPSKEEDLLEEETNIPSTLHPCECFPALQKQLDVAEKRIERLKRELRNCEERGDVELDKRDDLLFVVLSGDIKDRDWYPVKKQTDSYQSPEKATYTFSEEACNALAKYVAQGEDAANKIGELELVFNDLILYLTKWTFIDWENALTVEQSLKLTGRGVFDAPADILMFRCLKARKLREGGDADDQDYRELQAANHRKCLTISTPKERHSMLKRKITPRRASFYMSTMRDDRSVKKTLISLNLKIFCGYIVGKDGVDNSANRVKSIIQEAHNKIMDEMKASGEKKAFQLASSKLSEMMLEVFFQPSNDLGLWIVG
ncbi:uncharacterized protein PAC_16068 [Phialocephala subalpina]|uniref:Uncharacterized protein n=1 Tax=Phialocephala subalpina TaxID=576137 RepID=A0A1L7XMJ4_9HELO|nr:uncharacterized protein PAC_16068 [Phialocephala subalpina]